MMKRVGICLTVALLSLLTILPSCGGGASAFFAGKSNWVKLTWTESSPGVTGFDVYRATVHGGPYQHVAGPLAGNSYTDYSVRRGGVYFYVMTARNSAGVSTYSNELKATP